MLKHICCNLYPQTFPANDLELRKKTWKTAWPQFYILQA